MGITPPAGFIEAVEAELTEHIDSARTALIYNLAAIGTQAVNIIRQRHVYKDQTGNLTSSVGYVIIEDGKVIMESSFAVVKNGAQGSSEGRKFAHSLASQYPHGITLVVVAGMNYAAYVEARGIGGMTTGEIYARQAVHQLLDRLTRS